MAASQDSTIYKQTDGAAVSSTEHSRSSAKAAKAAKTTKPAPSTVGNSSGQHGKRRSSAQRLVANKKGGAEHVDVASKLGSKAGTNGGANAAVGNGAAGAGGAGGGADGASGAVDGAVKPEAAGIAGPHLWTENQEGFESNFPHLAASRLPIVYVLGLLAQLQPLSFHVFDTQGNYLEKFNKEQEDNWNVLHTDIALRKSLIQGVVEQRVALFNQEYPVLFGGVALADDLILLIGPTLIRKVDSNFIKLYAARHEALNVVLQLSTPAKMGAILLLIYSSLTGQKISLTSFLDRYLFNQELLQQTHDQAAEIYYDENVGSRPHNPLSFEHDIIKAIQHGDLDSLDRALNSPYAAMRGVLAKDPLRSQKNLAIVDITLASRSLTDIGFPSEEIFIVSDAAIRNVEHCRDVEEAKGLARAFAVQCAKQVKARHQDNQGDVSSYLVHQACEYMDRHVYDKFDVQTLAAFLKVSAGYLSKLFKQERRMTMGEYMRRKKVSIAAILLANTDQSLDDIAHSLAFSSQSHFGRIFVQEMGCTPAVYRKRSLKPKRPHDQWEGKGDSAEVDIMFESQLKKVDKDSGAGKLSEGAAAEAKRAPAAKQDAEPDGSD